MNWLTESGLALALAMAVVLLAGTNRDYEADQTTQQIVSDRAAESEDIRLALYVAEHESTRGQHPSSTQPVRRRHPSTLTEEKQ